MVDSVEAFVKRMEDRAVSAKSAGTQPAARVTAPVYRNGVPLGVYNQIAAEAERKYPSNHDMQACVIKNQIEASKQLPP